MTRLAKRHGFSERPLALPRLCACPVCGDRGGLHRPATLTLVRLQGFELGASTRGRSLHVERFLLEVQHAFYQQVTVVHVHNFIG